jgi:ATP-dependent RNA circularization protein (DNA/RNA ligase family)
VSDEMKKYNKINSVYKRDLKGKFLLKDWADPAFEYLKDNVWVYTEKVDGTNVRVCWDKDLKKVVFGGRTDAAQMPVFLIEKLNDLFTVDKFLSLYADCSMVLYGEGYGAKIQKGGDNYNPNGSDFVLFDILIADFWLERENVQAIADKLGLRTVPIIGEGSLLKAIEMCETGFHSKWGPFIAEGIVARPKTELKTRRGDRIITKVKWKDFH